MTKSVHSMNVEEAIRELKIPFAGEYHRQREAKDVVVEALEQALEQESTLDKARAEIEEHADRLKDSLYGDGMRHCIDIIDKYKAEYVNSLEEEIEEEEEYLER